MPTSTEIANQALAHLGKGNFIASLDEASAEAKLAKMFHLPSVKATLREFHWPFATRIATAQLIETDPNSEWGYSYTYPSDCIDMKRILSGIRNDTNDSIVRYRIIGSDQGKVILTDKIEAELEYTKYVSNTAIFPDDFELAVSFRWAMYMAPKILGADRAKQVQILKGDYMQHISVAKLNAAMEQQRDAEPTNGFVNARR
jgi:hypothetical protein